MSKKDTQTRKWQVTINNPEKHGVTHDSIKQIMEELHVDYWCMCDEIGGKEQTYHIHVYFFREGAIRFTTVKNKFPAAHLEMAIGTHQQNRDYIRKEGAKNQKKLKEENAINLIETFEESGEVPLERQGARNDIADLYDMIKSGMTNFEIIEESPKYLLNIDKVERARQIVRENQFKNTFRKLEVSYISGATESGKTRGVMEQFGFENVYRVINYDKHPWDNYDGQDIVVFEEFRSSFKIQEMLNYLDGYPLMLPCRYANKVACFTKVFIISNESLEEQYKQVQIDHKETWKAFLRRIHKVKVYSVDGATEYTREEYFDRDKWTEYDCENEVIPEF